MLAFAVGFNGLQTFNAVSALDYYFQDSSLGLSNIHLIAGAIIMVLTALTIFGGMKRFFGNCSIYGSIIYCTCAVNDFYKLRMHGRSICCNV